MRVIRRVRVLCRVRILRQVRGLRRVRGDNAQRKRVTLPLRGCPLPSSPVACRASGPECSASVVWRRSEGGVRDWVGGCASCLACPRMKEQKNEMDRTRTCWRQLSLSEGKEKERRKKKQTSCLRTYWRQLSLSESGFLVSESVSLSVCQAVSSLKNRKSKERMYRQTEGASSLSRSVLCASWWLQFTAAATRAVAISSENAKRVTSEKRVGGQLW